VQEGEYEYKVYNWKGRPGYLKGQIIQKLKRKRMVLKSIIGPNVGGTSEISKVRGINKKKDLS